MFSEGSPLALLSFKRLKSLKMAIDKVTGKYITASPREATHCSFEGDPDLYSCEYVGLNDYGQHTMKVKGFFVVAAIHLTLYKKVS